MEADGHRPIGRLLRQGEAQRFLRRKREIQRFLRLAGSRDKRPRLLVVHGSLGIGKSAFVRACRRAAEDAGLGPVAIAGLDEPARAATAVVFDPADEVGGLTESRWSHLLDRLDEPTLIVACSRRPPHELRCAPGWGSVLEVLELPPLPDVDARRLTRRIGLVDERLARAVLAVAAGNPLLLTLLGEAGATEVAIGRLPPVLCDMVLERTAGEALPDLRESLWAAAVVRTLDEELLAAMVDHPAGPDFETLARLSFASARPRGLVLHHAVRQALVDELSWRRPDHHLLLRRRAHAHLTARARERPGDSEIVLDVLHLSDRPIVHGLLAHPRGPATAFGPPPGDWRTIAPLLEAAIGDADLPHLRRLFELAPESFRTLAGERGEPVAIVCAAPLHRAHSTR